MNAAISIEEGDALILAHARIADSVAAVFARRLPRLRDEFESACYFALVQATRRAKALPLEFDRYAAKACRLACFNAIRTERRRVGSAIGLDMALFSRSDRPSAHELIDALFSALDPAEAEFARESFLVPKSAPTPHCLTGEPYTPSTLRSSKKARWNLKVFRKLQDAARRLELEPVA